MRVSTLRYGKLVSEPGAFGHEKLEVEVALSEDDYGQEDRILQGMREWVDSKIDPDVRRQQAYARQRASEGQQLRQKAQALIHEAEALIERANARDVERGTTPPRGQSFGAMVAGAVRAVNTTEGMQPWHGNLRPSEEPPDEGPPIGISEEDVPPEDIGPNTKWGGA
jgi:hypothetical protein